MRVYYVLLMMLTGAVQAAPFDHSHTSWSLVLQARVVDGRVDYAALKADRSGLDRYVEQLGAVDSATLQSFTRPQQLAFWLNAYNAFTLRTVIDAYPLRRGTLVGLAFPSNSIWQIPGAFRAGRWSIAGRKLSLDDIEHRILRPQFREPLIHMALVCAAVSCPPLRAEAYVGERVQEQLLDQAARFLQDRTRGSRLDVATRELYVSSIFKWFSEDFASLSPSGHAESGIREFVLRYNGDAQLGQALRTGEAKIRYLDYDWTLNDRR